MHMVFPGVPANKLEHYMPECHSLLSSFGEDKEVLSILSACYVDLIFVYFFLQAINFLHLVSFYAT